MIHVSRDYQLDAAHREVELLGVQRIMKLIAVGNFIWKEFGVFVNQVVEISAEAFSGLYNLPTLGFGSDRNADCFTSRRGDFHEVLD